MKKTALELTKYILKNDSLSKDEVKATQTYSDVIMILKKNSKKRRFKNAAKRFGKEIVKGIAMAGEPYAKAEVRNF